MKTGKLCLKLVKYETVNLISNILIIIFGFAFPIGMVLLFSFAFGSEVEITTHLHTTLFFQFALTIPLATLLIGHAVNYASELESGAVLRFKLFGYGERTLLIGKMLANLIFLTIALGVYSLIVVLVLDVAAPTVGALFTFLVFFYVLSVIIFVLGHAVATLFGQVGKVMGVCMALYFFMMVLGGMMGVQPSILPNGIRHIAMGIPFYYMSVYLTDFWFGTGSMNWLPFILSTVGMAIVAAGLFVLALWLKKKGKIKDGAKPVYYD